MMRIDTSHLSGWEDRTVVLEFQHADASEEIFGGQRYTTVRLVEFERGPVPSYPESGSGGRWQRVESGWKRTLVEAESRCSPDDQFCKETGRRVALRRLAAIQGRATYSRLRKAAIRQYFEDRARRRKAA